MTVIKKLLLIAFLSGFFSVCVLAQSSLNVYPMNNSFGVRFRNDKTVSPELRLNFQLDMADGESNYFVKPEAFLLYNFCRDETFHFYSGLGLGVSFYNQASNVLCATIPLGVSYEFTQKRRLALIAECGASAQSSLSTTIKSYALIGLQIRLFRQK